MVFVQGVFRNIGKKLMVLEGEEVFFLRQEIELEEKDGGLGMVYQNFSVNSDRIYSRDLQDCLGLIELLVNLLVVVMCRNQDQKEVRFQNIYPFPV